MTALIIPNLSPSRCLSLLAFSAWWSKTTVTDPQIKSWCPKCRLLTRTSPNCRPANPPEWVESCVHFRPEGLQAGRQRGHFIWEGNSKLHKCPIMKTWVLMGLATFRSKWFWGTLGTKAELLLWEVSCCSGLQCVGAERCAEGRR